MSSSAGSHPFADDDRHPLLRGVSVIVCQNAILLSGLRAPTRTAPRADHLLLSVCMRWHVMARLVKTAFQHALRNNLRWRGWPRFGDMCIRSVYSRCSTAALTGRTARESPQPRWGGDPFEPHRPRRKRLDALVGEERRRSYCGRFRDSIRRREKALAGQGGGWITSGATPYPSHRRQAPPRVSGRAGRFRLVSVEQLPAVGPRDQAEAIPRSGVRGGPGTCRHSPW